MVLSSETFTLQLYRSLFRKFSPEVEKCIMWGSVQVLPNQVSKNSFHIRLKILTYESPMQSYLKTRVKLWKLIQFKGQKSASTVFLGALTTSVWCQLGVDHLIN